MEYFKGILSIGNTLNREKPIPILSLLNANSNQNDLSISKPARSLPSIFKLFSFAPNYNLSTYLSEFPTNNFTGSTNSVNGKNIECDSYKFTSNSIDKAPKLPDPDLDDGEELLSMFKEDPNKGSKIKNEVKKTNEASKTSEKPKEIIPPLSAKESNERIIEDQYRSRGSIYFLTSKCKKCGSTEDNISFSCNENFCKMCWSVHCCQQILNYCYMKNNSEGPFEKFEYRCINENCQMVISIPTRMVVSYYLEKFYDQLHPEISEFFINVLKCYVPFFDGIIE